MQPAAWNHFGIPNHFSTWCKDFLLILKKRITHQCLDMRPSFRSWLPMIDLKDVLREIFIYIYIPPNVKSQRQLKNRPPAWCWRWRTRLSFEKKKITMWEHTHTTKKKLYIFFFLSSPAFNRPTAHPTHLVSLCSLVISYKWLPFLPFPFFFFFWDASLSFFSYLPFFFVFHPLRHLPSTPCFL